MNTIQSEQTHCKSFSASYAMILPEHIVFLLSLNVEMRWPTSSKKFSSLMELDSPMVSYQNIPFAQIIPSASSVAGSYWFECRGRWRDTM